MKNLLPILAPGCMSIPVMNLDIYEINLGMKGIFISHNLCAILCNITVLLLAKGKNLGQLFGIIINNSIKFNVSFN